MSPLITSSGNPRIVAVRKLRQKKHRVQQDRFLMEGLQLVARALDQRADETWKPHIVPQELFYCPEQLVSAMAEELVARFEAAGGRTIEVGPTVLESLVNREMNQGLVATFARAALAWSLDDVLVPLPEDRPRLLLLLDGVQYPGNLGTLLRTADAVGCHAVLQHGASADATDPIALRGSMGSVFAVRHVVASCLETLRDSAYQLVGAEAIAEESLWEGNALQGDTVLCLGNEAHGLSPEVQSILNRCVALPMQLGVDSLNVAVAGGVLMYEWKRRNARG